MNDSNEVLIPTILNNKVSTRDVSADVSINVPDSFLEAIKYLPPHKQKNALKLYEEANRHGANFLQTSRTDTLNWFMDGKPTAPNNIHKIPALGPNGDPIVWEGKTQGKGEEKEEQILHFISWIDSQYSNTLTSVNTSTYTPTDFFAFAQDMESISDNYELLEKPEIRLMDGGRKIFSVFELSETVDIDGRKNSLVCVDSIDSSAARKFFWLEFTLRCQNQLIQPFTFRVGKNARKVTKHTQNFVRNQNELSDMLEHYLQFIEARKLAYAAMKKVNMTHEQIMFLVFQCATDFKKNSSKIAEKLGVETLTPENFVNYQPERRGIEVFENIKASVQIECSQLGFNLFGALNALTHHLSHNTDNKTGDIIYRLAYGRDKQAMSNFFKIVTTGRKNPTKEAIKLMLAH